MHVEAEATQGTQTDIINWTEGQNIQEGSFICRHYLHLKPNSKSCQPKVYEQKYAAKYKLEICEISDKVLFFLLITNNDNEAKFERWYKCM